MESKEQEQIELRQLRKRVADMILLRDDTLMEKEQLITSLYACLAQVENDYYQLVDKLFAADDEVRHHWRLGGKIRSKGYQLLTNKDKAAIRQKLLAWRTIK